MPWLVLLLLLVPPPAGWQSKRGGKAPAGPKPPAAGAARFPIEALTVEGNRNYSAQQILAAAAVRPGQPADKELFEAARERLMATGAFESVGYEYRPSRSGRGYVAAIHVVEVAQVYPFRFERLNAPEDQLLACLRNADPLFAEKLPATQPVLDRYARAIETCPAAKDLGDKVAGRLIAGETGEMIIVFRPVTPPAAVAEVRFFGNKVIPTRLLQNTIAGVAIGSAFTEPRFRQLLDSSIRPLYEARGRLRVAFPKVDAAPSPQVKGVVVSVEVDEGQVYKLGEVRFAGEDLPEERLREAGDFKSGDVADFAEIEAGIERVKRLLRRNGHMKPETRLDRRIRDDTMTVDLTVHVDKGPQYTFGKLTVEGLDILGEAAIKKLWAMKPGAPFDADYPGYFLRRIREDGVFDNLRETKSSQTVDEKSLTVEVTLIFK